MPLSHRVERIAEQIREEVSQILATEVADPGIGLVTVTRVKVSPDLSLARIYWTIMGDAAERNRTQKALGRAAAYVRHLLATRMTLRRSPEVAFIFDASVAAQDRVEQILQEIKQQEEARAAEVAIDASASTSGESTASDPPQQELPRSLADVRDVPGPQEPGRSLAEVRDVSRPRTKADGEGGLGE